MRKSTWLLIGAGLGALTGLAVVALAYLVQQALALPFIPFVLFDWLTRVLPGGVITLGIDSMVRAITGLGLGPIDVVAKGIEQAIGIALWLVVSALIGLGLAAWLRERPGAGTGRRAGTIAGVALAVLVILAMVAVGQWSSGQPWTLLLVGVLLPGWGAVLGGWLERAGAGASAESRPEVAARSAESRPDMNVRAKEQRPINGAGAPDADVSPEEPAPGRPMTRREFLLRVGGGSLALAAAAGALGGLLAADKARTGAGRPLGELKAQAAGNGTPVAATTPGTAVARGAGAAPTAAAVIPPTPSGRIMPAPGTRPEITPTDDFYRIDIDLFPPSLDGPQWQLQVGGLFDRPRALTLADLVAMPAVTQPITQSCISNPIGGDLIGSTYYTGVRLVDVLAELGVQPSARALALRSADGFYETVTSDDMQDPRCLLVYGMNGTSLPVEHGYPLRIYRPNRYGMKQPKWITSMEAVGEPGSGYWVDRGWSPEARPQVISIIDTVAKGSPVGGKVPVGGIAWAGDRGIKSVEVQVDDAAWAPATLITPPIGPLTWVQWRYDWPAMPGSHTFRVRATDGKGTVQNGTPADTYPDGATGYHEVTVDI